MVEKTSSAARLSRWVGWAVDHDNWWEMLFLKVIMSLLFWWLDSQFLQLLCLLWVEDSTLKKKHWNSQRTDLSSLTCRSKLPCWVISGIPRLLNILIRTILRWVVLRLNHHFEEISIARWPASLSQWPCHGESKILYSQGWPRCSGRSNIRYLPEPRVWY